MVRLVVPLGVVLRLVDICSNDIASSGDPPTPSRTSEQCFLFRSGPNIFLIGEFFLGSDLEKNQKTKAFDSKSEIFG